MAEEVWSVFRLSDNYIVGSYPTEKEAVQVAAYNNRCVARLGGYSEPGEIFVAAKGEPCDPNIYGPDAVI